MVGLRYCNIAGVYYAAREIPGECKAVAVGETDFGVAMAGIPCISVESVVWRGVGYNLALGYGFIACKYC